MPIKTLSPKPAIEINLAKEILEEYNVFGPDEWKKFFGEKVLFTNVPDIPWSADTLRNPGIRQEPLERQFLFLGTEHFDRKPLNILLWHKLWPGPFHPKFKSEHYSNDFWYENEDFAKKTCGLRWYLMPRATFILPTYHIEFGGTFKPYHLDQEIEYENSERYKREQSKINKVPSYEEYWSLPEFLPDTYETPETVERITANILHYLLKSTYLDTVNRARTYSYANHRFGERESAGNVCIETDQQGLKFSIGDGSVNVYASRRIASAEEIIHIRANREFRINELKEKEAERFIHSDN